MAESMERQLEVSDQNDYPAEATVGDQSLRLTPFEPRLQPTPLPSRAELRQCIAQKAYKLYLQRGKTDGHDLDDWLEAERMVVSQLAQSQRGRRKGDWTDAQAQ